MTFTHRLAAPLALVLLLLAACGPAGPEQTEQPAATEVPAATVEAIATPLPAAAPASTDTPVPAPVAAEATATAQPVAEPAPTATPEPEADWTRTASLVDGLYVRGNPDAPVRLIDYSDFF